MKYLKYLLLFLCLLTVVLTCSCKKKAEPEFAYEKTDDGIVITGYNGSANEIEIPEEIDGKTVVALKESAFEFCKAEKITVPKTVTEIGNYAFRQCPNLKTVTMLGEIKEIKQGMFNFCTKMTGFEVPSSVEIIGENAFGGTGLLEMILPDSVKEVRAFALYGCNHLKTFKSGSGLEKIERYALSDCISLVDISLNEGLKTIGESCFLGCMDLKEIEIPTSVEVLEQYVLAGTAIENYVVPEGIKTIRSYAFAVCKSLNTIRIGSGVTVMETDIFNETKDFVIIGDYGSKAEMYADLNGFDFEYETNNENE